MENEILAAEIFLHPVDTSEATKGIDEELAEIERKINDLTCEASRLDYAVAVCSGLLAGAVDAFIVKETNLFENGTKDVSSQIREIIKRAKAKLPENEKVQKPKKFKAAQESLSEFLPYLEKIAERKDVLGFAASLVVQAARGGLLVKKENRIEILPEDLCKGDRRILAVVTASVGILKWLNRISKEKNKDEPNEEHQLLGRLCALIGSVPAFGKVVNAIEKWQKQLLSEMREGKTQQESGMGTEKVFQSFFSMLATVPALNNTKLKKAMNLMQNAQRRGITDIPLVKMLNRQAFPVLINEIIVRTLYFGIRLAKELERTEDVNGIEWENVLPIGNRTIDRMLAVSTMTLSIADTADAAIHAAIDSCGNSAMFAVRFVTRFNYVAAGRSAVAVVKEVSYEKQQADLIHMKRLLAEAKTEKALEILQQYQHDLEERVSSYLAEDIGLFLKGFDVMDRGLETKNSDLVIAGNVIIQRVLGREPQFTSQQEFNDLMDSDMPLKL